MRQVVLRKILTDLEGILSSITSITTDETIDSTTKIALIALEANGAISIIDEAMSLVVDVAKKSS